MSFHVCHLFGQSRTTSTDLCFFKRWPWFSMLDCDNWPRPVPFQHQFRPASGYRCDNIRDEFDSYESWFNGSICWDERKLWIWKIRRPPVDMVNPSIIYKVCYIPGRWDRDFWTINSICLRSCIDLTILILTSYGPLIMNSPRNHERISDSVLLLGSFVAKNPTHMENFSTVLYQQKSTSFQRIQPIVFFVSLAIFYKLFAYHISFTFIFWLANFSERLIKNTLSRLFAVSGLQ